MSYASGHVIFARDETLMAQPFDLETRQLRGDAFPLADRVTREGSRYVGASVWVSNWEFSRRIQDSATLRGT
jgi:hypothetical protein